MTSRIGPIVGRTLLYLALIFATMVLDARIS